MSVDREVAAAYESARGSLAAGNWAGARAKLDRILQDEPRFWPARIARGECLFRLDELGAAGTDFRDAHAAEPDSSVGLVRLGEVELETGLIGLARDHFDAALILNARSAEAFAGIALADFYTNDLEAAEAGAARAIVMDPECVSARVVRAVTRLYQDDYEAAVEDSTVALRGEPTCLTARAIMCLSRIRSEPSTVQTEAHQFASERPVMALEMVLLGTLAVGDQDYERFRALLDESLRRVPDLQVALETKAALEKALIENGKR